MEKELPFLTTKNNLINKYSFQWVDGCPIFYMFILHFIFYFGATNDNIFRIFLWLNAQENSKKQT